MKRRKFLAFAVLLPLLFSADADYLSAKRKFDLIESERLKPGSRVTLTPRELNSYVQTEALKVAPEGVRNLKLELGTESASGFALIDFGKLQRAQGQTPSWLMSKLLDGERPVRVTARIHSAAGHATVEVQRVEISSLAVEGRLLDFLIHNYLLPMYPEAKIGEPFELGHRIERLDVKPAAVAVIIGR